MSSIIQNGDTFHGTSVDGRGVFAGEKYGSRTYAGQIRDGYACGLGVLTYPFGDKVYAEHGPDGKWNGRRLVRYAAGYTGYRLHGRGEAKDYAHVFAGGTCDYNDVVCAPDDPRLLALIAQVAPVEVRPAALEPATRHSDPKQSPIDQPARFAPSGAREGHGHRGAPPRRSPSLMAVRHNPTTGAMPRIDACTRRFDLGRTARGHDKKSALLHPDNRRRRHTKGWFGRLRCDAIPTTPPYRTRPRAASCTMHVSVRCTHARDLPLHSHPIPRARPFAWFVDALSPRASIDPQTVPVGPLAGLCQFCHPVLGWQAEEAVANLPLRVLVRVHCGHQACAQHDGAHARVLQRH
jgi:hypothetical protein